MASKRDDLFANAEPSRRPALHFDDLFRPFCLVNVVGHAIMAFALSQKSFIFCNNVFGICNLPTTLHSYLFQKRITGRMEFDNLLTEDQK